MKSNITRLVALIFSCVFLFGAFSIDLFVEFIENSLLKIPLGGIIHYNYVKKLTECKF